MAIHHHSGALASELVEAGGQIGVPLARLDLVTRALARVCQATLHAESHPSPRSEMVSYARRPRPDVGWGVREIHGTRGGT
jgi:hypothetical protein